MALTRPRASQIYNIDYKQATRVVTVTNITLAGGAPSQVDGVSLVKNDRVLVTGQSTGSQNGIYFVQTLGTGSNGTWVRTSDNNTTGELLAGTIIMVTEGLIYSDTQWKLITDDPITIGTTSLTFTQNYSANSIASGNSNVTVLTNSSVLISSAGSANVLKIDSGVVTITGNLIPASNVAYSLGNTDHRFSNLWLSNSTIYLGNVVVGATATTLTVNGANVVTAPANADIQTSGNVSATGNVTGGNILTVGLISATGNLTGGNVNTGNISLSGNVISALNVTGNVTGGNILTVGQISSTGNITTAGYVLGNVFFANGITASKIYSGDSEVNVTSSGGNVNVSIGGTSNVVVFATTGEYVTGVVSVSGNVTSGNLVTAGLITATGNVTGGNILTSGLVSATGNLISGNVDTVNISLSGNVISALNVTGNIAGGNISTPGLISSTGNVTSGNLLTGGLISSTGNVTSGNLLTSGLASITGNATAGNVLTAGLISSTGNATAGNVLTSGIVSATGNIIGGNVTTVGLISATGNITTAGYFLGNVACASGIYASRIFNGTSEANIPVANGNVNVSVGGTTNVAIFTSAGLDINGFESVSGNITGGNLLTAGLISSTGNATAGNILTAGVVTATGNVTGGNFLTTGLISSTGTITSAANITGGNLLTDGLISATGAIYSGNIYTSGGISLTGNTITSSGATLIIDPNGSGAVDGNVVIAGNLSVQGNVTYIDSNVITTNEKSITLANNVSTGAAADGAGIDVGNTTIAYWRFNNATTSWQSNIGLTPVSNATLNLGGTSNYWGNLYASNTIVAGSETVNGNITGGNLLTSGVVSATGNLTSGNVNTTNISLSGNVISNLNVTGNIAGGNILTSGLISSAGNTTSGNLLTGGQISATANITGGNILTAGVVSATGNITTAGYFLGNVACASGIYASRIFNGNSEANIGTSGGNANISIGGTSNVVVFATTGEYVTGILSVSGNVTGGNILTSGLISSTGNATAGNILTAGLVSATGNITGSYLFGNASQVTGINTFNQIFVTGSGTVNAVGLTSNVTLTAGNNISLTSAANVITIAYSASGSGSIFATGGDMGLISQAVTSSEDLGSVTALPSISYDLGTLFTTSTFNQIDMTGFTSNINTGNLNATGLVSATGNVYGANLIVNGLEYITPNYITVSANGTSSLSATKTTNILVVTNTGLTATLNMPASAGNGQVCLIAVSGNTVTLALGTGTLNSTFAGSVAVGTAFKYVYNTSTATWYKI